MIRHGQTEWNVKGLLQGREEIPLNEEGLRQGKNAALELYQATKEIGFRFDKVISSPLSRASVTARVIAEALVVNNVVLDARLIERDFGILSGGVYDKTDRVVLEDIDEPTVESVSNIIKRVTSLILENAKNNENILLVTHGAVARIYAENAEKSEAVSKKEIGIMGNCHMVIYSYENERIVLEAYDVAPGDFEI